MNDTAEQSYAPIRITPQVGLGFHPSYNSRHFQADYGRRYYFDPLYRIDTDMRVSAGLNQRFGKYGMGSSDPQPVIGGVY